MTDTVRTAAPRLAVDVQVRRYPGVSECDVVIISRNRELVLSCPDYEHAMRWAAMERKSYKVPARSSDGATSSLPG